MKVTKRYGKITVDISFPDDPEDFKKLQDIFTETLSGIISKKLQPGEIERFEEVFLRTEITV
ncbi:hypothetical protein H7E67_03795 [Clostridium gasigenes]|uniref:hypothetical protein n=1 Tax=Clostridium gasigenes TaxID=94869 RepID=UPI00162336D0|nr:hypothetical protein [Clostridium gasigenes]MBB6622545.1 hypothetical protein [Clostridium gasigenes]